MSSPGAVLTPVSPHSIEGGRRQKLRLTKDDIMMEVRGSSEHVIGKGMLPARECGYYVIPYTKYPDTDLAYVLDIYTSCEATAVPVQGSENWVCKRVAGEWIPGHNAGGSRQLSRTWLNNPFYSLTLQYPTSVVVMITQLPRLVGPDAFKPPPTTKAGILSGLATSVRQLRHDQMGQGPTEPHARRGTFLLSSGGAGGRVLLIGL